MIFHGMVDHIGQHAGNVSVGSFVENLLVAARAADQPGGAEQAQMVADKGLAGTDGGGDVANGDGAFKTGEDDLEPRGVAEQAVGFGDDGQVVVFWQGHGASHWLNGQ